MVNFPFLKGLSCRQLNVMEATEHSLGLRGINTMIKVRGITQQVRAHKTHN